MTYPPARERRRLYVRALLELCFPFSRGTQRDVTAACGAAAIMYAGPRAAVVVWNGDAPGEIRVRASIGWRAWIPWIRRRVRDAIEDAIDHAACVGAIARIEVGR